MTKIERILAPHKERYPCTNTEETVEILKNTDLRYYLDDINYMTIGDYVDTYCFHPYEGDTDNFYYILHYREHEIFGEIVPERINAHLSFKDPEKLTEILELFYVLDSVKRLFVNVPADFDTESVLAKSEGKYVLRPRSTLPGPVDFTPTEESFILPEDSAYSLVSAEADENAVPRNILKNFPHMTPRVHPRCANIADMLRIGLSEEKIVNDYLQIFDEENPRDVWTLYREKTPLMTLHPNVVVNPVFSRMSFMCRHLLYTEDVTDEMIDYALKSLLREYGDRGFIVKNIACDTDDPFEGYSVAKRIGMIPVRQFLIFRDKRRVNE